LPKGLEIVVIYAFLAEETLFPALYEMENSEEKVTVKEREFKGTP